MKEKNINTTIWRSEPAAGPQEARKGKQSSGRLREQ